jgi:hypothetical protein
MRPAHSLPQEISLWNGAPPINITRFGYAKYMGKSISKNPPLPEKYPIPPPPPLQEEGRRRQVQLIQNVQEIQVENLQRIALEDIVIPIQPRKHLQTSSPSNTYTHHEPVRIEYVYDSLCR